MQAQSLIFFFNAHDFTLGETKEYSPIPICIFFIWVFLALDPPPPLWPSVYVLQAPGPAAASVMLSLLLWVVPTFVISQLEQHDLELFKAACIFCIKKRKRKKKAKRQKVI